MSVRNSRVREYRFGPGSLESISLKMWRHPDKYNRLLPNYRIRGTVVGYYAIYCGAGNTHAVEIDEELDAWVSYADNGSVDGRAADLWLSDSHGDAEGLADEVIEWALMEWCDPWDVEGEEQ